MPKSTYRYIIDDEVFVVDPKEYTITMQCCDCGLVHLVDFDIVRGKVQFKFRRDNRKTSAVRRAMGKARRGK